MRTVLSAGSMSNKYPCVMETRPLASGVVRGGQKRKPLDCTTGSAPRF
jgi:hypothetical protein